MWLRLYKWSVIISIISIVCLLIILVYRLMVNTEDSFVFLSKGNRDSDDEHISYPYELFLLVVPVLNLIISMGLLFFVDKIYEKMIQEEE